MSISVERQLLAQQEISHALAKSSSLLQVSEVLLKIISNCLDWDMGALWQVNPETRRMHCVNIWRADKNSFPLFTEKTRAIQFERGAGIPGRVLEDGCPVWIDDVAHDRNFPRGPYALAEGLHSAAAFPIRLDVEMQAVMEFFSREIRSPDQSLLNMMAAVGSQVGLYIERCRINDALKESEERYRIIAETASDAILTIDHESKIVYANAAVAKIFGYGADGIIGKSLTDLMPERYRPQHRAGIEHFLKTGKRNIPWQGIELPGLHKSGNEVSLEISFGTFAKGDRHFFTGIVRDVTYRKNHEDALRRAHQESESANRHKDEFLAILSHELRTPLTPILGWTRLLCSGKLSEKETMRGLVVIERNARMQAQLVEDLLDISRVITGKLQIERKPVDLALVIEAALDAVRPLALTKTVVLDCKRVGGPFLVNGDSVRLQQVFWNLLNNSIKFTPAAGRVQVTLQHSDEGVQVSVSDTGIGIAPEFLPQMFQRFRQADSSNTRAHGGLGIGLSLVQYLVSMHNGTVSAGSDGPGKGAVFTVLLPVLDSQLPPARRTGSSSFAGPDQVDLKNVRVLVVDDDVDTLEFISMTLRFYGADVTTATNAADALPLFEKTRPHVVLSDIGMPGEDGCALIRKIRLAEQVWGGHVQAGAITAFVKPEDEARVLAAGFQIHIPKPIHLSHLAEAVAALARPEPDA